MPPRRASTLAKNASTNEALAPNAIKSKRSRAAVASDEENEPPRKKATGKSKKNLSPDASELRERVNSLWKAGAHVSAAGGVENAIVNAAKIGANSFALFLKSQRKWVSPPLTEKSIKAFKEGLEKYGYDPKHILPHGSYLINLGNPDEEKRKKSYDCFLDDLKRCEKLGILLYNFHPGSSVGKSKPEDSMAHIAECINNAHKATSNVVVVLENMAGAGSVIGRDFDQLKTIIDAVDDKERVGVCLDTCHMFSAGYDIRTKEAWDKVLMKFDDTVGLKYLRGMHLNDSKTELNSKKDRHENIGTGHIGLAAFHHILRDSRVQDIPLILETPTEENPEVWAAEIGVLNRLSTLDEEGAAEKLKELVKDVKAIAPVSAKPAGKPKKAPAKKSTKSKKKADSGSEDEDGSCDSHDED